MEIVLKILPFFFSSTMLLLVIGAILGTIRVRATATILQLAGTIVWISALVPELPPLTRWVEGNPSAITAKLIVEQLLSTVGALLFSVGYFVEHVTRSKPKTGKESASREGRPPPADRIP